MQKVKEEGRQFRVETVTVLFQPTGHVHNTVITSNCGLLR